MEIKLLKDGNTTVLGSEWNCFRMKTQQLQGIQLFTYESCLGDGQLVYHEGETTKTKYIIYGYFYIFLFVKIIKVTSKRS